MSANEKITFIKGDLREKEFKPRFGHYLNPLDRADALLEQIIREAESGEPSDKGMYAEDPSVDVFIPRDPTPNGKPEPV